MSLGGVDSAELDPLEEAVETLTAEFDVLFVIAAGNDGADAAISSPSSADSAVSVGAVDKNDELAVFSSRGPRVDGALKPDLTAPGVEIVAANSATGFLGTPGDPYTTLSGTSMSTPHVAGAAAILAQQQPDWSPAHLKAALLGSAAPHPDLAPYSQGAGRLDVARAIGQTVTASPPSVSFDRPLWPHDDDAPQTRTVTYLNGGADDVTLDLATTTVGPEGEPAPEGFFTTSDSSVTVPAGGSAEVSIDVDTSVGDVDGFFGGYLTATAPDGIVVTTAFAVDREVESYDVTLVHTDRDGAPTANYDTLILSADRFFFAFGEPEVTLRLPAGDYFLGSFLGQEVTEEQFDTTLLVQPRLEVTGDQTVQVDARLGEPVSIGVPDREAVPTYRLVDVTYVTEDIGVGFGAVAGGAENLYTAQLGPAGALAGLSTTVGGGFAVPTADGDLAASRTVYNLAWLVEGEVATGFDREAKRRDLATVRADHAVQVDGAQGVKAAIPFNPEFGGFGVGLPMALPLARTEYLNTDGGLQWLSLFDEVLITDEDFETVILLDGVPTEYRAGRTYHERWNYAVFGPVLPSDFSGVVRFGDELVVAPDLYGDGAGHWGFAPSSVSISVFRDGELIVEDAPDFVVVEVPPELATYRVEVEAERAGSAPLSRQTSLTWEFESESPGDEVEVQLPVSVVRLRPKLAPDNTAPAGRPFLVPVSVDPAPASEAGSVASLTVEVSYNDGETWRKAPVIAGQLALLFHPRGDGFVSLRAAATDTTGNTVEQTVIRAYQIG
jgi:hypothetical protein